MISEMHLLLFAGVLVWASGHEVSGARRARAPIVEAYGLPKAHSIRNYGYIDNIAGHEGSDFVRRKLEPTATTLKSGENIGNAEIVDSDTPSEISDSTAKRRRSIGDEYEADSTNDLKTDEAKVFRPLFVYRQQIARQRLRRFERERRNNAARAGYEKSTRVPHGYRFG